MWETEMKSILELLISRVINSKLMWTDKSFD